MEYLNEEYLGLLLNKEWLVKTDSVKSVPYLLKFYASPTKQNCCILITDTKQAWGEVLSSKHLSRRWKDCNPQRSPHVSQLEEAETEWRLEILDLLSAAHTLGGSIDLSFEVVESRNADLAIELGSDYFKWRWETYSLGPKVSADVLSQHLIMPLISVTHLAFSSSDPVSELSGSDLGEAVDKVARTARRSVDTHVKHAMTKPRVATSLSRISAISNFITDSPTVLTEVSTPELKLPSVRQHVVASEIRTAAAVDRSRATDDGSVATSSDNKPSTNTTSHTQKPASVPAPRQDDDDSVTEAETDEEQEAPQGSARVEGASPRISPPVASASGSANRSRQTSPKPLHKKAAPTTVDESSDSSPVRPNKKAKRVESSSDSEDSEAERRRRLAARQSTTSSRGTKQPIRRGARRF